MKRSHTLALSLLAFFHFSCSTPTGLAPEPDYEAANQVFCYEGLHATYHVEVRLDSAFDGLHFSSFAVQVIREDQPMVTHGMPSIVHAFTYYQLEGTSAFSKGDFDYMIFVNGASTGESGWRDGVVIVGSSDGFSARRWTSYKGEVSVDEVHRDETYDLAIAAITEYSIENDWWGW